MAQVTAAVKDQWADVTDAVVASGRGGLQYIEISYRGGQWAQYIYGIRIDGKLYIDKGNWVSGDSKVSTVSPKQGQGTISGITGSVVTIEPFTDNCFVEGQYLIHETPKPVKITPISDTITDVTGDVLELSGPKNLINFAPGDTVSMVNADGSAATFNAETSAITSVTVQTPPTGSGWISAGSQDGKSHDFANLFNGSGGYAFGDPGSDGSLVTSLSISHLPYLLFQKFLLVEQY